MIFAKGATVHVIRHIILLIILSGLTSCYKEVVFTDSGKEVFRLSVSPAMQGFIYSSRDTSYVIDDPDLQLTFNDQPLDLKVIRTRGKSALRYQRKSYTVILNEPIKVKNRNGSGTKMLSRFKLIALAMDYTYIENRIAFGILEEAEVMPLFYRYVEFIINGYTQGIYLLLEDPEQYFEEQGSEFILRRGYDHHIDDAEYEPSFYIKPEEEYINRYSEIYSALTRFHGEELYHYLSQRLDLEQYFRKIGIDYLLQNGDYTDEIYLYAMIRNDTIRYHVIPWDYDHLRIYPHEVGISWGMGTLFGERYYPTHQDILDEIGDRLVFSIEDDLDYTIAKDSFLYAQYERSLAGVVEELDQKGFGSLFDQIEKELTPFYSDDEIVSQSQFDNDATSPGLWMDNMKDKQDLLGQRLEHMKTKLWGVNP